MTTNKAVILFVMSFVTGFILNDMARVSFIYQQERKDEKIKKEYNNMKSRINRVPYEFLRVNVPEKVIRGYDIELVAWIKVLDNQPESCELIIKLLDAQNKLQSINRYALKPSNQWIKGQIIQFITPKFILPETVVPGRYNLELELVLTEPIEGITISTFFKGKQVEVINFSS